MARLRRWELRACARHGHATYAPTEPALAGRLSGTTGVGEVWRCLRCSDFVLGPPHARGPADEAPLVLRGKALRQAVILRLLAAERLVRAVLLGLATYGVLRFRDARGSIQAWLERYLPALRATGVHVDQFALVRDLQHALAARSSQPTLVAALLGAYAALEAIEGVGLWLLKRWGEYFAAVATAIFLPLEVRELIKGVTATRCSRSRPPPRRSRNSDRRRSAQPPPGGERPGDLISGGRHRGEDATGQPARRRAHAGDSTTVAVLAPAASTRVNVRVERGSSASEHAATPSNPPTKSTGTAPSSPATDPTKR